VTAYLRAFADESIRPSAPCGKKMSHHSTVAALPAQEWQLSLRSDMVDVSDLARKQPTNSLTVRAPISRVLGFGWDQPGELNIGVGERMTSPRIVTNVCRVLQKPAFSTIPAR
jgi:hypothetical protein